MYAARSPASISVSDDDLPINPELSVLSTPTSSATEKNLPLLTLSSASPRPSDSPIPDQYEARLWRHFQAGYGRKEAKTTPPGLGNMGTTYNATTSVDGSASCVFRRTIRSLRTSFQLAYRMLLTIYIKTIGYLRQTTRRSQGYNRRLRRNQGARD